MTLNETIYKRKSTRKFDMTPLGDNILADILSFISTLKPLYEGIRVDHEFVGAGKMKQGMMSIKAPHYIIISSENKDGYLANVGFIFQQVDLYLQSIGLGSCWLGMAKPAGEMDTELEFVIALAFGKPEDSPHRKLPDFKRKALAEISNNADKRLEPARLAPSSANTQPWYFLCEGENIHTYCVKFGALKARMFGRLNKIDMGIALAHLYVANTDTFEFFKHSAISPVKGHHYVGSIKI